MKLIQQPNRWSCGAASLAMILEISVREVTSLMGHDGSQIIFPTLPEPLNHKGFPISELVDAAFKKGIGLVQIDAIPVIQSPGADPLPLYVDSVNEARIEAYLQETSGLALGQYSVGKWHMVAYERGIIYDPTGPCKYPIDSGECITIEALWLKSRI